MCINTVKKNYNDQEIVKSFIEKHNEQRKTGKYCDYVLKSEDGESFTVHKDVLESVSPFFEKLLNSEIIGVNKESLLMQKCSSNVLENIIEFMYTGKIEIISDFAKETLDVALFLGLNTLVDACTQILVEIVNAENCFELLSYSETYHCGEDLTKHCIKVIYENLQALQESSEILELSSESMKMLVSYERNVLDANMEEILYSIVIKWLTYDLDNRKQFISSFIDEIKFHKISLQFGIEKILKDDCLLKSKELFLKIHEVISKNWDEQIKKNKNQTVISTETPDLYAVIGSELVLYNFEMKQFSNVITRIFDDNVRCAYSTFGNKQLFVGGGLINGKIVNKCKYYSMIDNIWNELPSMRTPRYSCSSITLNNKIYVCGGSGEKTVEIFDINKIKWERGPSFDRELYCYGLSSHNESIYCVGKNGFQYLDTKTNKWIELPLTPKQRITTSISHENYIYGFSLEGIHTFDLRANKWLESEKLYEKKYEYFPRVCKKNNYLYILGRINVNSVMLNTYNINNFSNQNCNIIEYELNENRYVHHIFSL